MRGVDVLIVSLKQHFPARFPEWWMSLMLVAWGIYVALHPAIFIQSASREMFSGMATMAGGFPPASLWGLSAVIVGTVRACALFVNGAYTRTPVIRVLMSFTSAFIWTQVVIGTLKGGVAIPDVVLYAMLVIMDIVSMARAATDMVFAEKVRHDLKTQGSLRHVRSSIVS